MGFVEIEVDYPEDYKIRDLDDTVRECHIPLSATPPVAWAEIFYSEDNRQPILSVRSAKQIIGNHVVIRCSMKDVVRFIIPDLRRKLPEVNRKYRLLLAQIG